MHKNIKSIYGRSIVVFVLLVIIGAVLIYFESLRYVEIGKQNALQVASAEASVLSQRLNSSISLTYTLEALLREKDFDVDQDLLNRFSAHLLESHPSISSLQYSPKGIVKYISPMAGNEAAIGHNLLKDPKRNKEAFDSVEKRILTVAGPFELLQGGVALVARLPIFEGENKTGKFWGFSTVLIKIDDLVNSTNIDSLTELGYSWNLYRIHPDNKQPHIFYGTSHKLLTDSVQLAINAPNAVWYLNLKPINGWLSAHYTFILIICITWMVVSFAVSCLAYRFFKQPYELKEQVDIRTAELREAKNVLAESEQRLIQIAENKQMWIWEVDSEGLYTYCSHACETILGFNADEIVGKKYFYDLFHPEDKFELKKSAFEVFEQRLPFNDFENRNISKAGDTVWLSTSGVPIVDDNEQLLGYRGADIDITSQKKLAEEHGRSAQLAILGTVAAGVAHEINNPINGVINYSELLKSRANNPEFVIDIATRISKESERIAKLTKDLLHYSKDDREKMTTINVNEVIDSALSLIAPKVKKRGIIVDTKLPNHLPEIIGNPQSLQQVIINLVDNAYDALRVKEGIVEEKVINVMAYIQGDKVNQTLCIEISDNGIGMSKEIMRKAKEAFFTTKPSSEGSGLGLSIVNDIVGKHKGHFDIESKEGEYTKVTICLPLSDNPS